MTPHDNYLRWVGAVPDASRHEREAPAVRPTLTDGRGQCACGGRP